MTMHTVYYLVHKDTGRRLKYYKTIAGARIAQRHRNARLGFVLRIQRTVESDIEYELCSTLEHSSILGTYCIVEDTIEGPDDLIVEEGSLLQSKNDP